MSTSELGTRRAPGRRGLRLLPPFAALAALAELGRGDLLAAEGLVVAEHFHKRALAETIDGLERTRMVRVGDHCLSFYRRQDQPAPAGAGEGRDSNDG